MKLRHYPIIAAFALLAASCSHEESADAQRADLQLTISASFADSSTLFAVDSAAQLGAQNAPNATRPSATRATATAFESGDSLGLYAVRSGGELNAGSNLINNHKFKVSSTGTIVGDMLPAFYPDQTSSLDLFSYYPYQSGNATADALGVLVGIRTHQTDFSSLMASDCCYGSKLSAAPSTAAHPLRFKHIFAQLRLNFSLYEGCPAIASVKILKIKDQAKLNLQTGVVTLHPTSTVVDIEPFVSSADAANPLQFTAILPAQSLSAACIEITLSDGTIYYYNATSPIALSASATNTLNLRIADRKLVTLDGSPIITAWGAISASGSLGESVNNLISLYWLAPHASFTAVDKITVSIVDILNRRREVEVTPTLDPLSSAEYATYTFPLNLGADAGYPQIIEKVKLYAGATLLRDAPTDGIVGRTLTKAGSHTLGLSVWIKISETAWNNVSGYGDSKTITVTPTGTIEWTATSSNPALTVTKSGNTATLKWAPNGGVSAPAARSATVTFKTVPEGALATLTTTQDGVIDRIKINGLYWSIGNLVADGPHGAKIGAPIDGGLYFQFGSLLGWKGGATGNGTGICTQAKGSFFGGSSFNAANEIAIRPSVFTSIANIGTTWPNQTQNLYYFGNTEYATVFASLRNFAGFADGSISPSGVGDPCTYYLGGNWRMPTAAEWKALANNQENNSTLAAANAGWTTSPTVGVNFNNSGTKLFIPASGIRSAANGSFVLIGKNSVCWSESVMNAIYALHINAQIDLLHPLGGYNRHDAYPVRCVQDAPTEPQPPTADQIVTINGLKWTTGNLVANGGHNAKVGAPTDHGLFFQFGSLLGWKGGATGDGTGVCTKTTNGSFYVGTTFNAANEIAVTPSAFTTIANIGPTWPNQTQNLYYFGLSSYATAYAKLRDFTGFSAGTLAASGVGDPCTYYLGGTWRMPTAEEFKAMCNNYGGGGSPGSANAAWVTSPAAGMNFNNNSTKLFIPASGCRNYSDGAIYSVGTYGYYWSESVYNATYGYGLNFSSGGVYPQGSGSRRYGFPVRCVQ